MRPVGGDTQIALMHRYLPSMLPGGYKTGQAARFWGLAGVSNGQITPVSATKQG